MAATAPAKNQLRRAISAKVNRAPNTRATVGDTADEPGQEPWQRSEQTFPQRWLTRTAMGDCRLVRCGAGDDCIGWHASSGRESYRHGLSLPSTLLYVEEPHRRDVDGALPTRPQAIRFSRVGAVRDMPTLVVVPP